MDNFIRKTVSITLAALLLIPAIFMVSCKLSKDAPSPYFTKESRSSYGRIYFSLSKESKEGKELSEKELLDICESAFESASAFLAQFDEEDSSSPLAKINTPAIKILNIDTETTDILKDSFKLSESTGGLYDPSLYALTESGDNAVGCDKFTFNGTTVEKADSTLKLSLGCALDGYALEIIIDYLKGTNVKYGIVSLNSTCGVFGEKSDDTPFLIDISDPATGKVSGTYKINSGYVSVANASFFCKDTIKVQENSKELSLCAVQSANAPLACALASIGYSNGSAPLLSMYEEGKLDFEAVMTEEDGTLVKTKKADNPAVYEEITDSKE